MLQACVSGARGDIGHNPTHPLHTSTIAMCMLCTTCGSLGQRQGDAPSAPVPLRDTKAASTTPP